uniref:Uncharacterized protein n=1 Tax=Caenorhabditis japonica TaxID=281687 RepID=A0A8R1E820_CAEJA
MDDLNRSFDRILDIKNHKFWIVDELALVKRNIRLNQAIWNIRTIQEAQPGNETEHPQNGLPRDHMNRKCLCVAYNVNLRSFLAPRRKTIESHFRRHFYAGPSSRTLPQNHRPDKERHAIAPATSLTTAKAAVTTNSYRILPAGQNVCRICEHGTKSIYRRVA